MSTFITHTFNSDLDITLTSPAGTVVTITTDNGSSFDNVFNGTLWDDDADPGNPAPFAAATAAANNVVTDRLYSNLVTATPLVPEEALSAFYGENPNGTWTLTIDDDLGGDTGTLNSWSLQVTTCSNTPTCVPPSSLAISSITATSAVASWSCPGCTGTFVLEYGPAGFTPGTGATAGVGGTVINPATSPQAISGLSGSTNYQVYVRQNCSGFFSGNSNVVGFNTLPANDLCANAIPLSCGGAPVTGTTVGATIDAVGTCGTALGTAGGVWYTIVGAGTNITVSTCTGTTFDTKLGVFTGACGAFTCVAGNDDACGLQSSVTFSTTLGTTYYILVTGFGTATGPFTLTYTCAPPINDNCASALPITCGGSVTGQTLTATADAAAGTCVTPLNTAPGVWYSFVGNGSFVTATTCNAATTFDTKLGVFTGTCAAPVCLTGNDDDPTCGFAFRSTVSFCAAPGVTYRVFVTGFSTATGVFQLNLSCTPPMSVNAGSDVTICQGTSTVIGGAPTATGGNPPYTYLWSPSGSLDDATSPNPTASPNVTTVYGVLVTDACGGTVSDLVTVNVTPYPGNNDCVNATPASAGVPINFTTECATTDGPDEPGLCNSFGDTNVQSDIWYKYYSGSSGDVTVSLCGSAYDTKIAIYEGDVCPTAASAVACADDDCGLQSEVTFNARCNTWYLIRIGGYLGYTGDGVMNITPAPVYDATATQVSESSCSGVPDGSAAVTVIGGTAPYTYLWDNGETAQTATALSPGSHTVTVTDANGCFVVTAALITQPSIIFCFADATDVTCNGANDGTATASAFGGTPPYTFNWTGGYTGSFVSGLAPGVYTLTVADANGCICTQTVTVSEPPVFDIVSGGNINEGDNGTFYNLFEVTIAGGSIPYDFDWNNSGYVTYSIVYDVVDTDGNGTPDTPGVTVSVVYADNATFSFTVNDGNDCAGGEGFSFSNNTGGNPILDINSWTVGPDNGFGTGSINVNASGGVPCPGYNYQWEGPSSYSGIFPNSPNLSGLPYGWYICTVTDCDSPQQSTIGWFWVPKETRGRGKLAEGEAITAYPNPAKEQTTIEFSLDQTTQVTLAVYSLDGKLVATLYKGMAQGGELYTIPFTTAHLPGGVYTATLTAENGVVQQHKLSVIH
ncbi:T9SS C-terminal target domain-containing protein [Sphingobacteriales bacterium UPWRP_1]|nr:hypothetical protein BVG80_03325 [Sphingobacteriales bacterium TSM_CSM]PSJ75597.1 T9SS C-terminal target domain-containing protein [Sphingobacteriales bacterium UPWRP_1]